MRLLRKLKQFFYRCRYAFWEIFCIQRDNKREYDYFIPFQVPQEFTDDILSVFYSDLQEIVLWPEGKNNNRDIRMTFREFNEGYIRARAHTRRNNTSSDMYIVKVEIEGWTVFSPRLTLYVVYYVYDRATKNMWKAIFPLTLKAGSG